MMTQLAVKSKHLCALETLLICILPGVFSVGLQYKLMTDLLRDHNKNIRPVKNYSDTLTVAMGMSIHQVIDLVEKNEILKIKLWLNYVWYDEFLTWDPSEYGGMTQIEMSPKDFWFPDITLVTDLRMNDGTYLNLFPANIHHDGKVVWNLPTLVDTSCSLDVTYFPWDIQTCPLKYGPWAFHGDQVRMTNLTKGGHFGPSLSQSGEWDVIDFPVNVSLEYYPCCKYPYSDIKFFLVLKRKPTYYINNLILPSIFVLLTSISVFYLPPAAGEKVSLSVTILLALVVFLLIIAEIMPPQSTSVPVVVQYFQATIILLAISTVMTVITLNVHYKGSYGKPVPRWVRKLVFVWLARILFMRSLVQRNMSAKENTVNATKENETEATQNHKGRQMEPTTGTSATNSLLTRMLFIMEDSKAKKKQDESDEALMTEWMLVAMVIDRCLLLLFLITSIVITTVILLKRPQPMS